MPEETFISSKSKRLFKVFVSIALLAYVLRIGHLSEIIAVMRQTELRFVFLAFGVYIAGQLLSAMKWRVLSEAVGFARSANQFVAYYFIAMFFNVFGLGTVGGDVMRGLYLAGRGGKVTLALNTVVADRVSGLLVLLGIAVVALLAFRNYELPSALYWLTLALSGALVGGWRLAPLLLPKVLPANSWPRRLVELDLAPYWNDYRLLATAAAMSFAFHLSQLLALVLLASSLGLSIPWSYYLIFGPLVNIFSALPISWNGLGVREGGYLFFLGHIGIGGETAVAFGLLWFALVILAGLIGGIVYLAVHESPTRADGV